MGAQLVCCGSRSYPILQDRTCCSQLEWLGTTIPEWIAPSGDAEFGVTPGPDGNMHWSRGDGTQFKVRAGPNYASNGSKTASAPAMYECVSVDIVRSSCIVSNVLGRLAMVDRPMDGIDWTPSCPLPRMFCIVATLPYTCDWSARLPSDDVNVDDPGCTVVSVHSITAETLRDLRSPEPSARVRLFRDFVQSAGGRCVPSADKYTTGVLKGIAMCENVDDVAIPAMMRPMVRTYNGTPALITKSGAVRKDPEGEWLEVNIDVRVWSYAARSALYNLRDYLPQAILHMGFVIQASEDDDLPEGIICACRLIALDLVRSPVWINDPRENRVGKLVPVGLVPALN
mmetsp:Transcript_120398/g.340673  ORF Transcript_120398/g.340673 Transcript_120398/m.340673 type:complete len:342 (+) Transcript_120398:118-1143(+)